MASKEIADLILRVLDGTEEFHLVSGVVRNGAGAVTNHGNSRRSTLAALAAYVAGGIVIPAGGISQATADGRYLQKANNLSDLPSAVTARGNLSVYSIAQVDTLFAGYYTKAQVDAAIAASGGGGLTEAALFVPLIANGTLVNNYPGVNTTFNATAVDTPRGIYHRCPIGTSGTNLKAVKLATLVGGGVAGAVWTATFRTEPETFMNGGQGNLIYVKSTSWDQFTWWGTNNTGQSMTAANGNSTGGLAVTLAGVNTPPTNYPWRRFRCDGTTIFLETSRDGRQWELFVSDPLAHYMGMPANGPDIEFGFGTLQTNNAVSAMWCNSFKLT